MPRRPTSHQLRLTRTECQHHHEPFMERGATGWKSGMWETPKTHHLEYDGRRGVGWRPDLRYSPWPSTSWWHLFGHRPGCLRPRLRGKSVGCRSHMSRICYSLLSWGAVQSRSVMTLVWLWCHHQGLGNRLRLCLDRWADRSITLGRRTRSGRAMRYRYLPSRMLLQWRRQVPLRWGWTGHWSVELLLGSWSWYEWF